MLLTALLQAARPPGVLFDLPHVIEQARKWSGPSA